MVSLREVLIDAGFDLESKDDLLWIISRTEEFEDLKEQAEDKIYEIEEAEFEE